MPGISDMRIWCLLSRLFHEPIGTQSVLKFDYWLFTRRKNAKWFFIGIFWSLNVFEFTDGIILVTLFGFFLTAFHMPNISFTDNSLVTNRVFAVILLISSFTGLHAFDRLLPMHEENRRKQDSKVSAIESGYREWNVLHDNRLSCFISSHGGRVDLLTNWNLWWLSYASYRLDGKRQVARTKVHYEWCTILTAFDMTNKENFFDDLTFGQIQQSKKNVLLLPLPLHIFVQTLLFSRFSKRTQIYSITYREKCS